MVCPIFYISAAYTAEREQCVSKEYKRIDCEEIGRMKRKCGHTVQL